MDHQVNETEAQIASRGNVAVRNWIISEVVTREHGPSLMAIDALQQQRGETVSDHDMLDQPAYGELGRRRPGGGLQLTGELLSPAPTGPMTLPPTGTAAGLRVRATDDLVVAQSKPHPDGKMIGSLPGSDLDAAY